MCTVVLFYPQSFLCFCAVSSFYFVIISLMVPHNVYQSPFFFLVPNKTLPLIKGQKIMLTHSLLYSFVILSDQSIQGSVYLSKKLDPDHNLSWNQFSDGHRCDYSQKSSTRQLPRHTSSPKRRLNDVEFNPEKTLRQ